METGKNKNRMQFPVDFDVFQGFNIDSTKGQVEDINGVENMSSKISQWPIKLKIVSPFASALQKKHLLISADCVAYAYGNFHNDFMKDKATLILCPKSLDTVNYENTIIEILNVNQIESLTLARMEVPCCMDITEIIINALKKCEKKINFKEVIVSISGEII
ncbi:iron-sulfur binding protein [Clostridium putrefaciens]|uniref:Iron-sulfur binding protein n=1 Tax=Clostridium putrefaciens TaxID=99675 RepID=A0A381JAZ6_9CLOT|nr:hypothetical protein [Clostridium putrefaciens]SUY47898.1 iron-sulfur binding protein [Clostridium putrefaciens]